MITTSLSAGSALHQRILDKTALVGVIGLGYVGLPLVRAFISAGYRSLGYDLDDRKIKMLKAGKSYIKHLPGEWIGECVENGSFDATCDAERLAEPDVLLICVPTPLNESRDPDMSYIEGTARQIAPRLRNGQLIVLESTTYPGTTREVLLSILSESGLQVGRDFFLAYSPEREDPGNPDFAAHGIPKVVAGLDPESLKLAEALYSQAIVSVVPVSSPEVAEACKLVENVYRAVNIAMVNELKVLFSRMGIDVWEVIDAAKTKPFGFQAFYPGPGLGGHCIPIDPFYLTWLARRHEMTTRFIELAGEINTNMPHYVIDQVMRALNKHGKPMRGSKICVLGMAYKKDVDDVRESPSFRLMELLIEHGAEVSYSDPHVAQLPSMRHYDVPAMDSQELTPEFIASQDCLLIATDHTAFDYAALVEHGQLVVDTRNATKHVKQGREKICKA